MTLTIEATYENGVLKPSQPLPFKEHERVEITVKCKASWVEETAGIVLATGSDGNERPCCCCHELPARQAHARQPVLRL